MDRRALSESGHRPLVASPLLLLLGLCSCLTSVDEVMTDRDTLSDPLGDIVALGGHIFATNEDHSGHAGSQVDLFRFSSGDFFPEGRFDLGINGVGYLAACSDGAFIYLQARGTGQLFKVSPVGEVAWTRFDRFPGGRSRACGIAYRDDVDAFIFIYHEAGTSTYKTVQHDREFTAEPTPPRTIDLPLFAPETGILAVTWSGGYLWALGLDPAGQAVIQGVSLEDAYTTRFIPLDDATACGLTTLHGHLVVAHADRRFEIIEDEEPAEP